jgi:hypothetical protein
MLPTFEVDLISHVKNVIRNGIVGHVDGIEMGFAPTQLVDLMVDKLRTIKSLPNPFHADEFSFWLDGCFFFFFFFLFYSF